MYKKVFKYTDFDGNEREEEHLFHLSKAEVVMWVTTEKGYTLDQLLRELAQNGNTKQIMEIVEDLILRSYGQKTTDGRGFKKSKELSEDFKATEAYSQLFMELISSSEKTAEFVNKILPRDLADDVDKVIKQNNLLPEKKQDLTLSYPTPFAPMG